MPCPVIEISRPCICKGDRIDAVPPCFAACAASKRFNGRTRDCLISRQSSSKTMFRSICRAPSHLPGLSDRFPPRTLLFTAFQYLYALYPELPHFVNTLVQIRSFHPFNLGASIARPPHLPSHIADDRWSPLHRKTTIYRWILSFQFSQGVGQVAQLRCLNCSSWLLMDTVVASGMEWVMKALAPMTLSRPMTVSPPRMEALA